MLMISVTNLGKTQESIPNSLEYAEFNPQSRRFSEAVGLEECLDIVEQVCEQDEQDPEIEVAPEIQ